MAKTYMVENLQRDSRLKDKYIKKNYKINLFFIIKNRYKSLLFLIKNMRV